MYFFGRHGTIVTKRVLQFKDNVAIVEASDGGQVEIKLGNVSLLDAYLSFTDVDR